MEIKSDQVTPGNSCKIAYQTTIYTTMLGLTSHHADHDSVVLLVCTVLCAGCYHIYHHVGTHFTPDHGGVVLLVCTVCRMLPYIPPCWDSLHTRLHISCTRVHDSLGRWGLLAIRAVRGGAFIHNGECSIFVASYPTRLSVPDFVSQPWRRAVRQNPEWKAWVWG